MKKGSVILNREMTTQDGKLVAKKGTHLVSVFLGAVKNGEDPEPDRRMHNLGWRQMAFFEVSVCISIKHSDSHQEDFDWRLAYACLGAVDAVEAAIRFSNKMLQEEFTRAEPGTPAPFLSNFYVATIKIGPIGEDGTPYNGRGSAFFGWMPGQDVDLEEHLERFKKEANEYQ